ncbi:spondin domain-containing protein [candidate division KSB1 bacterium]|nr:spondin domain-containing protein [candidate division KSB1 bacterium]
MLRKIMLFSLAVALISGCDKNDNPFEPDMKTMFKVTVANVASPKMFASSGTYTTPVGASSPAPLFPGDAFEFMFSAAPGSYLSFASMFGQSNDLFYAPSEMGIALFDNSGMQVTGDVTSQVKLWDAGTEINQEPGLGPDQAPRQAAPNTGAADPDNMVRAAADDFSNLPGVSDNIKVTISSTSATGFKVRIENVGTSTILHTSDGEMAPAPVSPGVWVVHTSPAPLFMSGMPDRGEGLERIAEDGDPTALAKRLAMESGLTHLLSPGVWVVHATANPLFTEGQMDMGKGLEHLAEDGNPTDLVSSVMGQSGVASSGIFNTPIGSAMPSPAHPGDSFEFMITAKPGNYLSFATMYAQSNDLFYAPNGMGISLFNGKTPVTGDVTSQIMLWDAGTEVNEQPGVGLNQAPRQSAPNTGTDENGIVQMVNDGFTYPSVPQVIKVTIEKQ